MVDIRLILVQAVRRFKEKAARPFEPAHWKRVNLVGLLIGVLFGGVGIVWVGSQFLRQPWFFLTVAVCLCFLFVLVNGISLGISDWNPISSAFVLTVFILAAMGLRDPGVGLLCAAILLIACSSGGDMQQDRSTGWRLSTNRVVQFRYQVIGIIMGAVLAVVLAKLFMNAYPILTQDQFTHPHLAGTQKWQSAMTYKFVGALKGITTSQPHALKALQFGIVLGLIIGILRKLLKSRPGYQKFANGSRTGRATHFLLCAVVLSSPYASAFGGFVELPTLLWGSAGGFVLTLYNGGKTMAAAQIAKVGVPSPPPDMSTTSLA